MKAYKVFNENWKCKGFQYEVGKTYTHKGEVSICESGFHACLKLIDCFGYYKFDSSNKVAEVDIIGKYQTHDEDSKIVCGEIKIMKELSWNEVLNLVNTGKDNTGNRNSGDRNSGDSNSGDSNSGNSNSGDSNSGNRNSGYSNSGYSNSGNRNSGYSNSGNRNSGDSNSGNYHNGIFCTGDAMMESFNKPTKMTLKDYYNSDLYINFDIDLTVWIDFDNMTDAEKIQESKAYVRNGYLKTYTYKQAWLNWWENNKSDVMIVRIKRLPNFDAEIFKKITGIELIEKNKN